MQQETGDSQSLTHSRLAECHSRQAVQARPDHQDRMVLPAKGLPSICSRWHQPQVDLFPTRFNNKLPQLVSSVPDMGSGCTQSATGGSEPICFSTGSCLGQVVEKLHDNPCKRIILIAPGYPNMPWFWDLVAMSSQIPLCLPNLLTETFSQILHRNLPNRNLHA